MLIFSLFLRKPSIWVEYLHTSQNDSTTNASNTAQIRIPHHVVNGINSNEYAVVNTEIIRVITIITIKYGHVIEESPAIKQRISSGNIGNRNISDKIR